MFFLVVGAPNAAPTCGALHLPIAPPFFLFTRRRQSTR